jgi:adenylate cyclase
MSDRSESIYRLGFAVSAVVFLVLFGAWYVGFFQPLELVLFDSVALALQGNSELNSRVAVVGFDEQDIRELGSWPISDAALARLIQRLIEDYRVAAVGLDIYRDLPVPPGSDALNRIFAAYQNIIGVFKLGDQRGDGVAPPPVLARKDQIGFSDFVYDSDGVIRRGMLYVSNDQGHSYSLALAAALNLMERKGVKLEGDGSNLVRLGNRVVPHIEKPFGPYTDISDEGYQFLLSFAEPDHAFPVYSVRDILNGTPDRQRLENQVVFVGYTATESVKDFTKAPSIPVISETRFVPGVITHTRIADQILRFALDDEKPFDDPAIGLKAIWLLLFSIGGALVGAKARATPMFLLFSFAGFILIGISGLLGFAYRMWIPVAAPAAAWLASMTLVKTISASYENRQRAILMKLFGKYVATPVAEEIWKHRNVLVAGGRLKPQRLTATVLFCDLSGFTAVAEKMEPDALFAWLEDYLDAMSKLISEHGGVVIRFIGDAILAVFGAPLQRSGEAEIKQDAVAAVRCAHAMAQRLIALNTEWHAKGLPTACMRAGIHTGPLAAGSLGRGERLEYTVHGDTVNIAARLESLEKSRFEPDAFRCPCRLFIGETTFHFLDGCFDTVLYGEIALRGKQQALKVYQVVFGDCS